eukprot:6187539-Pleurochrysis_carterae.AAC.1
MHPRMRKCANLSQVPHHVIINKIQIVSRRVPPNLQVSISPKDFRRAPAQRQRGRQPPRSGSAPSRRRPWPRMRLSLVARAEAGREHRKGRTRGSSARIQAPSGISFRPQERRNCAQATSYSLSQIKVWRTASDRE